MSTAIKSPNPEPAHHYIVRRTVEACHMAKEAAGAAAEATRRTRRVEMPV